MFGVFFTEILRCFLEMFGKQFGHYWYSFRKCWEMLGKLLGNVWEICRKCLGNCWEMFGDILEKIWGYFWNRLRFCFDLFLELMKNILGCFFEIIDMFFGFVWYFSDSFCFFWGRNFLEHMFFPILFYCLVFHVFPCFPLWNWFIGLYLQIIKLTGLFAISRSSGKASGGISGGFWPVFRAVFGQFSGRNF